MIRLLHRSLPLAAGALVLTGCGEELGGVRAKSDVSIKVIELDDEDVPTVDRERAKAAGVEVPVLTPTGQVVVPPDREDLTAPDASETDESSSDEADSQDPATDE